MSLPNVPPPPLFLVPSSVRRLAGQTPWATYSGNANIVDHFGFYNGLCQPRGRTGEIAFPKLQVLRICIAPSVDRMIPLVLRFFVNARAPITELHLAATDNKWCASELTTRSASNMREQATPNMPLLKHLTIFEPAWRSRGDQLLTCIMRSAPKLQSVTIKEEAVPVGNVVTEHTARLNIKTLACIPVDHTFDMNKVIGLEKHVENMVIQHTSLGETEEIAVRPYPRNGTRSSFR